MKRIPAEGVVGHARLAEAASTELTQVMSLVRAALQARYDAAKKPGESYAWFDIEAMYADRAIVCKDGRFWQFDYALDAANQVQLGEPKEVIEQFLPVALKEALELERGGKRAALLADGEPAVFLEAVDAEGKEWDAVLVRSGVSKNGNYYPDAVLREAAPLFEGARVYAVADIKHLGDPMAKRDINQLAGWISSSRFVEGKKTDTGYVAGRLNIAGGQVQLRETLVDAWRRGKRDLVGLSIDVEGTAKRASGGAAKRVAGSITKVNSVDLIVEPSAGGALVRLAEAADDKEKDPMKEKMLAAIKAKNPTLDVSALSDEQILERYTEAVKPEAPAPEKKEDKAGEALTREEFQEYQRLTEARAAACTRIDATTLPQPSKDELKSRFARLARFSEADVDNEIKAERAKVVRIAEALGVDAGKVKLAAGDIQVEDRSAKVAQMMDAFFNPGGKDKDGKPYPAVHSFKECYIEVTGDSRVTGRLENCDRSRLAESVGAAFRGVESLDSTSFSSVLGSAITRRLIADYRLPNRYDVWRPLVNIVPVSDFRTNERTRFGGYGDLPAVGEGNPYQALTSPTDEKASYAVSKKGGTEDITLEMLRNDDVGAIRQIPVKLSRSAKRTLSKFVLDFVRTNPAIYDTVAFFHAAHGNLGAAALDATSLAARRLAMLKQTEKDSAERLGIGPKYLVVPLDLEEAAVNLFNRNTNNDKTFVQEMTLAIVPVWYWTDTNDWALAADPMEVPGIEVAFLDGREEPELFVQDNPNVGSLFSNDKITYKIRFIFGGTVVEFRGWDKSVV